MLNMFMFYAGKKMYIKAEGMSNDIKLHILVKLTLSAICFMKTLQSQK